MRSLERSMSPRRRSTLVAATIAATALGAGLLVGPRIVDRGSADADALRDAKFLDLHGRSRILSEWGGRILVVNFWATWCAHCLAEIPMLAAARKFYAPHGVEIVGIAIDLVAKVIEFATKMSIEYPILVADADGIDLMRRLGNNSGGLPYTVFLDPNRTPVRHKLGALRREEFDAVLGELLLKYR